MKKNAVYQTTGEKEKKHSREKENKEIRKNTKYEIPNLLKNLPLKIEFYK